MAGSKTTTVLLMDPNKDDRQHWRKRLKSSSSHYKVFAAKDAETGLAVCQSERIDCVVMELHLPDMSGFQVLLRLNPIICRSLQTPVVALSNFTDPSIAEAAKQLGAQSYLIKSQASGDLHRAIQTAILRVEETRKEVYKLKTETHFAEKSAA
jgi:DNA-binding NarL/FixJ family response regulator